METKINLTTLPPSTFKRGVKKLTINKNVKAIDKAAKPVFSAINNNNMTNNAKIDTYKKRLNFFDTVN